MSNENIERLEVLAKEGVSLPGDVMTGYITERHELLRIINRAFTAEEGSAIMDAFAGTLEMKRLLGLERDRLQVALFDIRRELTQMQETLGTLHTAVNKVIQGDNFSYAITEGQNK